MKRITISLPDFHFKDTANGILSFRQEQVQSARSNYNSLQVHPYLPISRLILLARIDEK